MGGGPKTRKEIMNKNAIGPFDKDSKFTQAVQENPGEIFDKFFTPQPDESPRPKSGERFQGPGSWYEAIWPVDFEGSVSPHYHNQPERGGKGHLCFLEFL